MRPERPNIVNLLFFVRSSDRRDPSIDLLDTFIRQLELVKAYGFKASFLLQYDALMDDAFLEAVRQRLPEDCEVGGWLELVQPLVEKAGIPWRGESEFDWHAHVDLTVGYPPEERIRMADLFMGDFRERLGYYPKTVGSWAIDAVTLAHLADRYGLDASCNCRDQWGTDGYTLWGGYYSQGYYPSRLNALSPAQTTALQIPVPVFRMLGSDPIYQYDLGLSDGEGLDPADWQQVVTLEPVGTGHGGGSDPTWVDWYFDEIFAPGVSFNYTQAGQENSFGWERMKDGLQYQFRRLADLQAQGRVCVQTVGETGRWFKGRFPNTPVTSTGGLTDWQGQGRKSFWFDSRFYRVNFYEEKGRTWIRDVHVFDEAYPERYLTEICRTPHMVYDTLPVMDGNRWSGRGVRAGIYPVIARENGERRSLEGGMTVSCEAGRGAQVRIAAESGELRIDCDEEGLTFMWTGNARPALAFRDGGGYMRAASFQDGGLLYQHDGYDYWVKLDGVGEVSRESAGLLAVAAGDRLRLSFPRKDRPQRSGGR